MFQIAYHLMGMRPLSTIHLQISECGETSIAAEGSLREFSRRITTKPLRVETATCVPSCATQISEIEGPM